MKSTSGSAAGDRLAHVGLLVAIAELARVMPYSVVGFGIRYHCRHEVHVELEAPVGGCLKRSRPGLSKSQ